MKNKLAAVGSSLIIMSLTALNVNAATGISSALRGLKPFWDLIDYLLNTLPSPAGGTRYIYFKFLLWLISWLLFMRGMDMVWKGMSEGDKKRANILTAIVALIAVINIPNLWIEFIATSYGVFLGLFLTLVVPIALYKATDNKGLAGVLYLVLGIISFIVGNILDANYAGSPIADLAVWLYVAAVILITMGIANLVTMIPGIGGTPPSVQTPGAASITPSPAGGTPTPGVTPPGTPKHSIDAAAKEVEHVLHLMEGFKNDIAQKDQSMRQELDVFKQEIDLLTNLLNKLKTIKSNIQSLTFKTPTHLLQITQNTSDLQNEINKLAAYGLQTNGLHDTLIGSIRLEDYERKISESVVRLLEHQIHMLDSSKLHLTTAEQLLQAIHVEQNLIQSIDALKSALATSKSNIASLQKIVEFTARQEYTEIQQSKRLNNIRNSNRGLIDAIEKNLSLIAGGTKIKSIMFGLLKKNLEHLISLLEHATMADGNKLIHKQKIYDSLKKVVDNLPAEAKIDDTIIASLTQIKQALDQISQHLAQPSPPASPQATPAHNP